MPGRTTAHERLATWWAEEIELRDGRRVLLAPIVPADRERVGDMLGGMSVRSRYLRFHGPRTAFSPFELDYLTDVDYRHHFAWVATAIHEPGAPIVGIARYVRVDEATPEADFAVSVVDDYQGQGLGEALLSFLALAAEENGVRRFVGDVLAENREALRLFGRLGGRERFTDEDLVRVSIAVPIQRRRRVRLSNAA